MKQLSYFFCIIIFLLIFSACNLTNTTNIDGERNPEISDIPEIELVSVNQTTVQQFADELIFTIEYVDGDGDLGSPDPDIHSIELSDNRANNLVFTYHLSPRAPAGNEITIQGTIDVVLENTILLDTNNTSETTTFSIRIKDETGNWSNTVTTQTITITQ